MLRSPRSTATGSPAAPGPALAVVGPDDATWDAFFVEFEASLGFPISPKKRDFVFETASAAGTVTDTVYAIWPVVPAASLAVGVRL